MATRPEADDIMRPDRLIVKRFAARGVWLWTATRLVASAVVLLAGASPLHLGALASAYIVAACLALGLVDMHRRHDRVLLSNLAVPHLARLAFFAVPAIVGESVIAAIGGVVG